MDPKQALRHTCPSCENIVVDLTQLDGALLRNGRIEWEGRPLDLGRPSFRKP
jgi:hypothetical protein